MQTHRINLMTKIFGAHAEELNQTEWLDATIKIVNGSGFILIVLVSKGNPNQICGIVQTVERYHNLRPLKIGSK